MIFLHSPISSLHAIPMKSGRASIQPNKKLAPVYGVDGQHSIPAHITVPVLQTGADGRHQWLKQFGFLQLAQEAQRGPTDELVGMLQVLERQRGGAQSPQ